MRARAINLCYPPPTPTTCCQCRVRTVELITGRKCSTCIAENDAAYYALRRSASVTPTVARQVWREANGRCEYCAIAVRPKRDKYDSGDDLGEIDHVVPVAHGGKGNRENLKLACKGCNRRRTAGIRRFA